MSAAASSPGPFCVGRPDSISVPTTVYSDCDSVLVGVGPQVSCSAWRSPSPPPRLRSDVNLDPLPGRDHTGLHLKVVSVTLVFYAVLYLTELRLPSARTPGPTCCPMASQGRAVLRCPPLPRGHPGADAQEPCRVHGCPSSARGPGHSRGHGAGPWWGLVPQSVELWQLVPPASRGHPSHGTCGGRARSTRLLLALWKGHRSAFLLVRSAVRTVPSTPGSLLAVTESPLPLRQSRTGPSRWGAGPAGAFKLLCQRRRCFLAKN